MATPQDWQYLRQEFKKILDGHSTNALMHAMFVRDPSTNDAAYTWAIDGGTTDGQDEFLLLAARAASLLGSEQWESWAGRLATLSDRTTRSIDLDPNDSAYLPPWLPTIDNVCLASADYCLVLATTTIEKKPSRSPSSQRSYPAFAAWLEEQMAARSDIKTRTRVQDVTGVDKKTIKKVLERRTVRPEIIDQIATGLGATTFPRN